MEKLINRSKNTKWSMQERREEIEKGTMVLATMKQGFEDTKTSLVIVNSKNSHSYRKLVQGYTILSFNSHLLGWSKKSKVEISFFLLLLVLASVSKKS